MLKLFSSIDVGPGQDVDSQDEATKRGLIRAAADGRALLQAAVVGGANSKVANGWRYPPPVMGRAGLADDFLTRAAIQCLGGIISNDPAEAVYLNTALDLENRRLSGAKRYVMRFAAGEVPKVGAFWSITMYGDDHNLIANPINRYAIGDRSEGLKRDADGSLTIYVQAESPGGVKEANWLPAPRGTFSLVLRTYMPAAEIVEQHWSPPPLKRVE